MLFRSVRLTCGASPRGAGVALCVCLRGLHCLWQVGPACQRGEVKRGALFRARGDRTRDLERSRMEPDHWAGLLFVLDLEVHCLLKCGRAVVALTEF